MCSSDLQISFSTIHCVEYVSFIIFVMVNIHIDLLLHRTRKMRNQLKPEQRFAPLQDELAGFMLDQIISENGKFYWRDLAGEGVIE